MNSFLTRLGDSRTAEHGAVSTGALATLALVNPRRLSPGKRLVYRMTLAGLTAWTVWASFGPRPTEVPVPPEVRAGITTAAAGAVMGAAEFGEMLDGKMHDGLVKRGVTRPRVWLALMTAALGAITWYFDRKSDISVLDAHGSTHTSPDGRR